MRERQMSISTITRRWCHRRRCSFSWRWTTVPVSLLSVLRIICAARQAGRDYCSLTPKERPSPGDSRARPSSLPDAFRTWFSGCANTAKPPPRGNRSRRGRLYFARRGAHRISLGNCAQASVDNAWAFDQERGPLHQSAIRWEGRYAPRVGLRVVAWTAMTCRVPAPAARATSSSWMATPGGSRSLLRDSACRFASTARRRIPGLWPVRLKAVRGRAYR
jgi:hypothetical protein